MKPRRDVRDWVAKAEEDYAVIHALLRKRRPSFNNAICFHAQHPTLELLRPWLEYLEPYAVSLRYPGEFARRAEATRSARLVSQLREHLRHLLSLN